MLLISRLMLMRVGPKVAMERLTMRVALGRLSMIQDIVHTVIEAYFLVLMITLPLE